MRGSSGSDAAIARVRTLLVERAHTRRARTATEDRDGAAAVCAHRLVRQGAGTADGAGTAVRGRRDAIAARAPTDAAALIARGIDARDGVGFDGVLAMRARAGVAVDGLKVKVPIYIRVTWLALNKQTRALRKRLFFAKTRAASSSKQNTAILPLDRDPTRT